MEQKNRILIVEDDTDINNLLYTALQKAGYETVQAFSGTEARMLFQMDKAGFSLILLDLMLPGISGEEVLAQIRKQGNTPVIVLTAKDGLDEKIGLLTSGADDYITKPFEIQEVLARIQVQLRHMQQEPEHKSVSYKNLELDRERFEVRIAGVLLPKITKQEFAILELLLEHPKQVFSKEEIFEYAWDEHYMGETKTLGGLSQLSAGAPLCTAAALLWRIAAQLQAEQRPREYPSALLQVSAARRTDGGSVLPKALQGGHRIPQPARCRLLRDSQGGIRACTE